MQLYLCCNFKLVSLNIIVRQLKKDNGIRMSQMLIQNQVPKQYTKQNLSNNQTQHNSKQQNFTGVADGVTAFLSGMKSQPMLEVAFVDTVATNVPRTVVDLKTGIPAALETARREFSGLIVNCLIPSFFVLGASKLINNSMMKGFKGVDMSKSWADQNSIESLAGFYKNAGDDDKIKNFVKDTIYNLKGFDKDNYYSFVDETRVNKSNIDKAVDLITDAIKNEGITSKETKKVIKEAHKLLVNETKAAEAIKFADESKVLTSNLSELLRDQIDLGKKFLNKSVSENLEGFVPAAKKMLNSKSMMGLAIVMPLAMSMQYINRAITRAKYHQKGAPIYKDFEKGNTHKEMTPAEKSKFFAQKCLAATAMVGVTALSIVASGKKISPKMIQFKGMFPTLDQCRLIATGTFVSRMFASEDPNELREATVRDIASFSGLYFLGDYAEKAIATLIEKVKPDVKIINRLVPDDVKSAAPKRFWNWVQNYKLKSFDEIADVASKNMRSLSQVGGLAFSIAALGILLPKYNRMVTEKKVQKQKELEATQKQANKSDSLLTNALNIKTPNAFKGFEKAAV